jgi:stearoyl-CoA desaturase (delta-9 desaturase)
MSVSLAKNPQPLGGEKLDRSVCIQFLFMHLTCLLVIWTGVSAVAVVTCLALYVVRMFAITS